ncbi:hypothetical protein LXL04_030909 [Taraxacum kok-saghyz]
MESMFLSNKVTMNSRNEAMRKSWAMVMGGNTSFHYGGLSVWKKGYGYNGFKVGRNPSNNHRHRQSKGVMNVKGEENDLLNFTYEGGFPALEGEDNEMIFDGVKYTLKTESKFARRVFISGSPNISPQMKMDQTIWRHALLSISGRNQNPRYVSLTPNIIADVLPPLDSHGVVDIKELCKSIGGKQFVAVYLDPIQGVGDLRGFDRSDMLALGDACRGSKTLLVVDETVCGLGRTGDLWGHDSFGIKPDVMLVDFGPKLGLSATLYGRLGYLLDGREQDEGYLTTESMQAAALVLKVGGSDYLSKVRTKGAYFKKGLIAGIGKHPGVQEIRSFGLIIGIQLESDTVAVAVATACKHNGLLVDLGEYPNILRLMPSSNSTELQFDLATSILAKALNVCY